MHLRQLHPVMLVGIAAVALALTTAPATASDSGNSGPYLHQRQHHRPHHGYQIHGGYRSHHARYVRYQPRQQHAGHHGYQSHGYYPTARYRRQTTLGYGHGHRHGSRYQHGYGCGCGCR